MWPGSGPPNCAGERRDGLEILSEVDRFFADFAEADWPVEADVEVRVWLMSRSFIGAGADRSTCPNEEGGRRCLSLTARGAMVPVPDPLERCWFICP
jgi:hypothetical protein